MDRKSLMSFAKSIRADLIGIAPVERFDELPPEKHPRSIFPEAESVVVVGRRITRGTLRGSEEGTNFHAYRQYGYNWLNDRFLAMSTFQVASFLEDNGYEAVPLPPLPSQVPAMGVPVRSGAPAPNVLLDMDDAAVRAGLGEIGRCGFLLTPQFGPRQRVNMILTDAKLEPTPLLEKRICLGDKCGRVCPYDALKDTTPRTICGKTMDVAALDVATCRSCRLGSVPNAYYDGAPPDRLGSECARTCVENLERAGVLSTRFSSPFRKRPVWKRQLPADDPTSITGR